MFRRFAASALPLVLAVGMAGAQDLEADISAEFIDNDGAPVGTLMMTEGPNGVLLRIAMEAGSLEPGWHGIHIHEVGDCSDHEAFEQAGDHLNPHGVEHGFLNPAGPHPADLPNIFAHQDGSSEAEFFVAGVTLRGGEASLIDDDGTAMLVHADADDHVTDPSGNSGDRVACAVME